MNPTRLSGNYEKSLVKVITPNNLELTRHEIELALFVLKGNTIKLSSNVARKVTDAESRVTNRRE